MLTSLLPLRKYARYQYVARCLVSFDIGLWSLDVSIGEIRLKRFGGTEGPTPLDPVVNAYPGGPSSLRTLSSSCIFLTPTF